MRFLALAVVALVAADVSAQCPNGQCGGVTIRVTVPARPAVVYAAPVVYTAPILVPTAPVVLVPARTPWYPGKWLSGRRGL